MKKAINLGDICRKDWNKIDKYNNSSYIFINGSGDVHNWFNDICYARMKDDDGIVKARMVPKQLTRDELDKEVVDAYVNWILHESVWKDAFICKHSNKNFIKNGLILNTRKSLSYVVGACIAMREVWEGHDHIRDIWYPLAKAGVSKEAAHIVASSFTKNGNDYYYRPWAGGHGSLPCFGPIGVKNYLNKKVLAIDFPMSKSSIKFSVFSLFTTEDHYMHGKYIKDIAEKHFKKVRNLGFADRKCGSFEELLKIAKEIESYA